MVMIVIMSLFQEELQMFFRNIYCNNTKIWSIQCFDKLIPLTPLFGSKHFPKGLSASARQCITVSTFTSCFLGLFRIGMRPFGCPNRSVTFLSPLYTRLCLFSVSSFFWGESQLALLIEIHPFQHLFNLLVRYSRYALSMSISLLLSVIHLAFNLLMMFRSEITSRLPSFSAVLYLSVVVA